MKISKEVKIGFTAVLSVAIIYAGMIFLKGLKLFSNEVSYYVEMEDVQGLNIGAEVQAKGMTIGHVKSFSYKPDVQMLVVEIDVEPSFNIPKGTTASISNEILGTAKLLLTPGKNSFECIEIGDTIHGETTTGLMDMASNMAPKLEELLPKLDSILNALNTLANDPSIANSLHNMEQISEDLCVTTKSVNSILKNDVPNILGKADNSLANLEQVTYSFSQVDISGIANKANNTLTNIEDVSFKLNTALKSKDNSLGMLINDNGLVLHLDSTLINASNLLDDMKAHPARYINISVFGSKKDK